MIDYYDNYIQAIDNPLPKLKETFKNELEVLKRYSDSTSIVLDVGCGAGRPAIELSKYISQITGIDIEENMIREAQKRNNSNNAKFLKGDGFSIPFARNTFDLTYSTYNTIGSIEEENRLKFIKELARTTKKGGKVFVTTWNSDEKTTIFLKQYYPSIGVTVIDINDLKTVTPIRTFYRIPPDELIQCFKKVGLKKIGVEKIDPLWYGIVGEK